MHLEPQEQVVEVVRRHWFTMVGRIVALALLGAVPGVIAGALQAWGEQVLVAIAPWQNILVLLATIWLLLIWLAFSVAVTKYYLDVLIVTTRRVVNVEQNYLFVRKETEILLGNIQDIQILTAGVIPSLLRYGLVQVQSAGETSVIQARNVPDPEGVRSLINRLRQAVPEREGGV